MADMPYVKIPTKASSTGYRRLRLDRYAEMVTRTKTRQAVTIARRNTLHETGHQLIKVNDRASTSDDACNLYRGKVFGLTKEAADIYGVPSVLELPNGGVPFHPGCKHFEIPFLEAYASPAEKKTAMIPPPRWALNQPFGAVDKIYRKRGMQHGKARQRKTVEGVKLPKAQSAEMEKVDKLLEDAVAVKPIKEKFVNEVQRKLNLYGGAVKNSEQAIVIGQMVKRHVGQQISTMRKGYKTELAALKKTEMRLSTESQRLFDKANSKAFENANHSDAMKILRDSKAADIEFMGAQRKLHKKIAEQQMAEGKVLHKELQKLRPFGGKINYNFSKTDTKGEKTMEEMKEFFPTAWINGNMSNRKLCVRSSASKTVGIGQYRVKEGIGDSIVVRNVEDKATMLHEFAHRCENYNPKLVALEKEYFYKRKALSNAKIEPLGPAYSKEMVGLPHEFGDRYTGRVYPGESYWEIFSTGIEALFTSSSPRTASDKDHMSFIIGVLAGL